MAKLRADVELEVEPCVRISAGIVVAAGRVAARVGKQLRDQQGDSLLLVLGESGSLVGFVSASPTLEIGRTPRTRCCALECVVPMQRSHCWGFAALAAAPDLANTFIGSLEPVGEVLRDCL